MPNKKAVHAANLMQLLGPDIDRRISKALEEAVEYTRVACPECQGLIRATRTVSGCKCDGTGYTLTPFAQAILSLIESNR